MIDSTESVNGKYLKKQNSFDEKSTASNAVPTNGNDEQHSSTQLCVIRISRSCEISINRSLIPLRIALFMWYGAARLSVSYLSVFMKQKGLSLVEYSSIFSVTFIFEFLAASVSGIIADKIGNAKPVLLFHILITTISLLSLILIPRINNNCDFINDDKIQDYKDENITSVDIKLDDINTTLPHRIAKVIIGERYVLDNHSVPFHISANTTGLVCGSETKNCTSTHIYIKSTCGTHHRALLILHMITIVIFFSSWSSVYHFIDVTVMSLVQKYDTSYGYERVFSTLGDIAITFITTIVLNSLTSVSKENYYASLYWSSLSMFCIVFIAVYNIETKVKLSGQNMWRKVFILLKDADNLVFIVVIFLLGTLCCFFDTFTIFFLEGINANTIVMGLQQTVYAVYGFPFFITSQWWIKIFGPKNLFILAFLGYTIYAVGYSFLYNPWLCLLIEALTGVTYHLLWVVVVTHSHQIAPNDLASTVVATAGAIHFGIGRSSGSVTGGFMMNAVGPRITYRILAGMSSIAAVLYATFLYFRRSTEKVQ